MELSFHEQDVKLSILKRIQTRTCLLKVIEQLGRKCGTVNYIFCSDGYLYQMNKTYLNHDTLTDIITFDYTAGEYSMDDAMFAESGLLDDAGFLDSFLENREDSKKLISGDIYISLDRVKENAKKFHVKQIDELNRVMIHGLLHLAGYKDKEPEEEKKMHAMEDKMLASCFPGYEHLNFGLENRNV